jgi:hypothetical protein
VRHIRPGRRCGIAQQGRTDDSERPAHLGVGIVTEQPPGAGGVGDGGNQNARPCRCRGEDAHRLLKLAAEGVQGRLLSAVGSKRGTGVVDADVDGHELGALAGSQGRLPREVGYRYRSCRPVGDVSGDRRIAREDPLIDAVDPRVGTGGPRVRRAVQTNEAGNPTAVGSPNGPRPLGQPEGSGTTASSGCAAASSERAWAVCARVGEGSDNSRRPLLRHQPRGVSL